MKEPYDAHQITHPLDVGRAAATVGGVAILPGAIIGSVYGTLRTKTPSLFAIASGAQCFILGTTFWGVRGLILNRVGLQNWYLQTRGHSLLPHEDLTSPSRDKVVASTASGAITGASLGALFRGPRNVIPGTIVFSLLGYLGQHGYNFFDERNSKELRKLAEMRARGEDTRKKTFMERVAESKWSPMKSLSDEEYEEMLQEKLLKVEAEIAIVDEKIEGFRRLALEERVKREADEAQRNPQP